MKGLIIYKGKYGATRQYSEWLSDELNIEYVPANSSSGDLLHSCDFVLLGSSVYIGKLLIADWLREYHNSLLGKNLFFFIVSGTKPDEDRKLERYTMTIPEDLRTVSGIHHLPGRMNYDELSWSDKITVNMGSLFMQDTGPSIDEGYDDVKKQHLEEILDDVRTFCRAQGQLMLQNLGPTG